MKRVTIYTKPGCPACVAAKNILNTSDIAYNEVVIGEQMSREQVIAMFPEQKTVPIIIVDGVQTVTSNLKQMLLEG